MRGLMRLGAVAIAGIALVGAACSPRAGSETPTPTETGETGQRGNTEQRTPDPGTEPASNEDLTVAGVVERAVQSVVRIESANGAFGTGVGSGFVVGSEGHLMTNNHVIQASDGSVVPTISVTLHDGAVHEATVVGRDPQTDTALLEIDATGLESLEFADDEDTQVGDEVVALGFPLDLEGGEGSGITVTTGIVSAKNRYIEEPSGSILGAIQTDAAINHGNSGGPLLSMEAEVVGMNTAIATNPDPSGGVAPGIGFAIGSETLSAVHAQLVENGTVDRGFLGITAGPNGFDVIRPAEARELGIPEAGGIRISAVVPDGPVAQAGMQEGDIIVGIGETEVTNETDLSIALIRHNAGETVPISYYRGGELSTVEVTLGAYPSTSG